MQLSGIVSQALKQLRPTLPLSGTVFGTVNVNAPTYEWTPSVKTKVTPADFTGYDVEASIGETQGAESRKVMLPPIRRKYLVSEWARIATTLGGDPIGQRLDDLVTKGTADAAFRIEQACGSVLMTGKFTVNGENGLTMDTDFERPASFTDGTNPYIDISGTAGKRWNTVGNDILGQIKTWQQTVITESGVRPTFAIMRQAVMDSMTVNTGIIAASAVIKGTTGDTSSWKWITEDDVKAVLAAQLKITTVLVIDDQYNDLELDHSTFLPDGAFVLLPSFGTQSPLAAMGASDPAAVVVIGTTAEAMDEEYLLGGRNGLIGYALKRSDPVGHYAHVSGVAMPVLPRANAVLAAKVQPA
jgi:hypothetical protein